MRRSQTVHRTLSAAWICSIDPPTRMTKVHMELRTDLAQIGIFTLLFLVDWSHHHIS